MKKALVGIIFIFFAGIVFSPFTTMAQQPKRGGTLKVGFVSPLTSIDPHKAFTVPDSYMMSLITEDLVASDGNYNPVPSLAENWEISKDEKKWTFNLRKSVKFHNGRELTAEDVKFSYDRFMDPKIGAHVPPAFHSIDRVVAADKYTVEIYMKKPAASLLAAIFQSRSCVIARECIEKDGNILHPIGTGPFTLDDWKPNDYFKAKRFEEYWKKGLPYLDYVIINPVKDQTVKLTALRSGDLDMTDELNEKDVQRLKKDPENDLTFFYSYGNTLFLHFNCGKPPFNDLRIRQAVSYAINREEINLGVTQGTGSVTNQLFPQGSRWHIDIEPAKPDLIKAKELLAQAGYPDGMDMTILTPAIPQWKALAEMLQAELLRINVNVTIKSFDWTTFVGHMAKLDFEAAIGEYPAQPDPVSYTGAFTPGGNMYMLTGKAYNNPNVNEILAKADETSNYDDRKALIKDFMHYFIEEAPWIFTTTQKLPLGWGPHVKGFEPSSTGGFVYGTGGITYTWLE